MPAASGTAFKFYVTVDGYAVLTEGLVYSWSNTVYITPIGLLTDGLVVGEGDFWQYADAPGNASWANAENPQNANWTYVDG